MDCKWSKIFLVSHSEKVWSIRFLATLVMLNHYGQKRMNIRIWWTDEWRWDLDSHHLANHLLFSHGTLSALLSWWNLLTFMWTKLWDWFVSEDDFLECSSEEEGEENFSFLDQVLIRLLWVQYSAYSSHEHPLVPWQHSSIMPLFLLLEPKDWPKILYASSRLTKAFSSWLSGRRIKWREKLSSANESIQVSDNLNHSTARNTSYTQETVRQYSIDLTQFPYRWRYMSWLWESCQRFVKYMKFHQKLLKISKLKQAMIWYW